MNKKLMQRMTVALAGCFCMPGAQAADPWPTRPVQIIVPAATGTSPDIMARLLGDRLSKLWGKPVVIDTRPGAGGVIGVTAAHRADDARHTLVLAPASVLTTTQYMYRPKGVNIYDDFKGVAFLGYSPMLIASGAQDGAASIQALLQRARDTSTDPVVATTVQYSFPHLAAMMLGRAYGAELNVIPFQASSQSTASVIGGDSDIVIDGIPPIEPLIKGGRLKPVVTLTEARLQEFPDVPTITEVGHPELVLQGWFGVLARSGLEDAIVERISTDVAQVLADAQLQTRLKTMGVYPASMSVGEFSAFWHGERARWEGILKDFDAQPY